MSPRQPFIWSLAEGDSEITTGERFAHNSALDAGIAAVRAVARDEGQKYVRVGVWRFPDRTLMDWDGETSGRTLTITVRRPSPIGRQS